MFAEIPLDNRTVDKFAALGRLLGLLKPLETSAPAKRSNIS
jgi:hypothetical protein